MESAVPAAGPAVTAAVALAAAGDAPPPEAGARRCDGFLRANTLTNANSMSDEKTNTRHTIIHMSIACRPHSPRAL